MLKKLFLFLSIFTVFATATSLSIAKDEDKSTDSKPKEIIKVEEKKDKEKSEEKKPEEKKTEEKEKEKIPQVTVSDSNKPITGVEKVEVKAEKSAVVDLQLQTKEGKIGTVYLGRVKVSDDKPETEFKWDSKNTPNGEYKLFGTVKDEKNSPVIVGPIDVKVDNSAKAIVKKKEEIKIKAESLEKKQVKVESLKTPTPKPRETTVPSITPVTSSIPIASTVPSITPSITPLAVSKPEVVALPDFEEVNTTSKDIVFPSEFNPKTIVSESDIKIEKVINTKLENNNVALTFKGKSLPNTVITLLIFSNPIVVTVKTDENGSWTYHLEKPLEPGKHAIYTVATKSDGTQVRSQVEDFFIAPAIAASSDNESLILASATEDKAIKNFTFATVLIIFTGLFGLFMLFKFKRKTALEPTKDDVS